MILPDEQFDFRCHSGTDRLNRYIQMGFVRKITIGLVFLDCSLHADIINKIVN